MYHMYKLANMQVQKIEGRGNEGVTDTLIGQKICRVHRA